MRHLLPALLLAGSLLTTGAALAQEAGAPPAPAPAAPASAPEQPSAPEAAAGEAVAHGEPMAPGATDEAAHEQGGTPHYPLIKPAELDWTFAGPFGHYDLGQLQRGLKVYREVCSACHSMNLVSFRNLEGLGYSDEQVRSFAAEFQVEDGPNASGEMFMRPGIPSDRFPSPFPNPEAAAAANNGAHPPDFSLLAKARFATQGFPKFVFDIFTQYAEGGPDYIHALLTGYGQEPPAHITIQPGTHYNPYFMNGPALAMAQPIMDDQVEYTDGTPQTVDQYSRDVAAFMMWAAEPHLPERKATGMVVMVFLIGFAIMVGIVKRRVWADTPH